MRERWSTALLTADARGTASSPLQHPNSRGRERHRGRRKPRRSRERVRVDANRARAWCEGEYGLRRHNTTQRLPRERDPLEFAGPLDRRRPDPGKHRTHFYAHYANRVRSERPPEEVTNYEEVRTSPRSADARPPGRGSSPRSFKRIRSSAKAAVARSTSWPTSPAPSRSAGSSTTSTSARRRSHLLRSEMSSACRWTTRGERPRPTRLETPISTRNPHHGAAECLRPRQARELRGVERPRRSGRGHAGAVACLTKRGSQVPHPMSPATVDPDSSPIAKSARRAFPRTAASTARFG
jgi:hypothetical protein